MSSSKCRIVLRTPMEHRPRASNLLLYPRTLARTPMIHPKASKAAHLVLFLHLIEDIHIVMISVTKSRLFSRVDEEKTYESIEME